LAPAVRSSFVTLATSASLLKKTRRRGWARHLRDLVDLHVERAATVGGGDRVTAFGADLLNHSGCHESLADDARSVCFQQPEHPDDRRIGGHSQVRSKGSRCIQKRKRGKGEGAPVDGGGFRVSEVGSTPGLMDQLHPENR
jgi:hypothetical protein